MVLVKRTNVSVISRVFFQFYSLLSKSKQYIDSMCTVGTKPVSYFKGLSRTSTHTVGQVEGNHLHQKKFFRIGLNIMLFPVQPLPPLQSSRVAFLNAKIHHKKCHFTLCLCLNSFKHLNDDYYFFTIYNANCV